MRLQLHLLSLVILGLVGTSTQSCGSHSEPAPEGSSSSPTEISWTCSMHPQVRQPEAGKCPICFMDLIKAQATGDEEQSSLPRLELSPVARALAQIETALVERRSVAHEIEMVGKVTVDETRLSYITTRVPGRLDRLFVDYTGVSVRAGDHLVQIYSPTLFAAQQEFLQARLNVRRQGQSTSETLRATAARTAAAARSKLRLLGFSEEQLAELVEHGTPQEHTTLYAPAGGVVIHKDALEGMYVKEGTPIYTIADLSKVWVQLEAYESDLPWLRYGQDVEFRLQAYPGETFHGRVAFIDPVLDDRTRTVKVRLNVDNPDQRLKPGMFVSATAEARLTSGGAVVDHSLAGKWMCPMHPEVTADQAELCVECEMDLVPATDLGFAVGGEEELSLVIPQSAPLITGKRAVVYVEVKDTAAPTYEGRVIALGPRAGDWYVVLEGVEEGERVVVNGAFKLDSELQIRAQPSMMSLEELRPERTIPDLDVPAPFRAEFDELVDAYLLLQSVLAADEDGGVESARLASAHASLDLTLLSGLTARRWEDLAHQLDEALATLSSCTDVASRRAALAPLSSSLLVLVEAIGTRQRDGDLGLFHCPMALDFEGAEWLQLGEEVLNPYFGAEMLHCGERQRVLSEGSSR